MKKESFYRILQVIRIKEALLLSGFSFVGFFFSVNKETHYTWKLFVQSLAIPFYYFAVYCQNSYFGHDQDMKNERMGYLHKQDRALLFGSFFCFFFLSFLFSFNNLGLMICMGLGYLSWTIYAVPGFGLKYKPLAGTFIHFISQFFQFFMGKFLINDQLVLQDYLTATGFCFLLAGGHLIHEMIDSRADQRVGIKNFATLMGVEASYRLAGIIFLMSGLTFIVNTKPSLRIMGLAVGIHLIIHFIWAKKMIDRPVVYRTYYRTIYLTSVLIVFLISFVG